MVHSRRDSHDRQGEALSLFRFFLTSAFGSTKILRGPAPPLPRTSRGFASGHSRIGFNVLSSYAELVVVDATQLVARPAGLAWAEAGALSASGQTAYTALKELGVSRGKRSSFTRRQAAWPRWQSRSRESGESPSSARRAAKNHACLRELGAIPVAFGDGLVERVRALSPSGVDVVLDGIGGDALDASIALVADRTRIGTIADPARPIARSNPATYAARSFCR